MSTATLEPPVTPAAAVPVVEPGSAGSLSCPHCKKYFRPEVDPTQPPRLQGAKCPNCKLFVPARIVSAALGR